MSLIQCCCSTGCTYSVSGTVSCVTSAGTHNPVGGSTVTIKDHASGAVLWTGTTATTGLQVGQYFTGTLTMSGTSLSVDIVNSKDGASATTTVTVVCGANTKNLDSPGINQLTVNVTNPCGGVDGCGYPTFTVSLSGPTTQSLTIPFVTSLGHEVSGESFVFRGLATGTYTYTATCDDFPERYGVVSGTVTFTGTCGGATVNLSPTVAAGYICSCISAIPLKTTLNWSGFGSSGMGTLYDSGVTGDMFTITRPGAPCCDNSETADANLEIKWNLGFPLDRCVSNFGINITTGPESCGYFPGGTTTPTVTCTPPPAFSLSYTLTGTSARSCSGDEPVTWTE